MTNDNNHEACRIACEALIALDKTVSRDIASLNIKLDERERTRDRETERLDKIADTMSSGFDELKRHMTMCMEAEVGKRRQDIAVVNERLDALKNIVIAAGLSLLAGIIVALLK